MSIRVTTTKDGIYLALSGSVSDEEKSLVLSNLIGFLHSMVTIDIGKVKSLDMLTMQVLRVAYNSIMRCGGMLSVINVPEDEYDRFITCMNEDLEKW